MTHVMGDFPGNVFIDLSKVRSGAIEASHLDARVRSLFPTSPNPRGKCHAGSYGKTLEIMFHEERVRAAELLENRFYCFPFGQNPK